MQIRFKRSVLQLWTILAWSIFSLNTFAADAAHGGHHSAGHGAAHPAPAPAGTTAAAPYKVTAYGSFRKFMQQRDFAPVVKLSEIGSKPGLYGVGAETDLKGEITIVDGDVILTQGDRISQRLSAGELRGSSATLLATSNVQRWASVEVAPSLNPDQFREFVLEQAKTRGIDVSKPFPFLIKGEIAHFHMHVLKRPNPKFSGHGSAEPMADMEYSLGDRISGTVVGFYAPLSQAGLITHPGDTIHAHFVNDKKAQTWHLDVFDVVQGATLMLPLAETSSN